MSKSDIEWTDETWNPTRGCKVCSPGCANCYAMRVANRFSSPGLPYNGLVTLAKNRRPIWNGESIFDADMLAKPLHWVKPKRVFVNSMSDLYYEGFSFEQIAAVYGVMAVSPHITYQVLTKRAARRNAFQEWLRTRGKTCVQEAFNHLNSDSKERFAALEFKTRRSRAWPLPNVWEGVSVENQAAADERIPELLVSDAAVRFLSCEPLLGELDLWAYLPGELRGQSLTVLGVERQMPTVDWVIVGCESGTGRRPCDDFWITRIRDQCVKAKVALFVKQAYRDGLLESLPVVDGKRWAEFPR